MRIRYTCVERVVWIGVRISEEASENTVTAPARSHAFIGKRVFTGIANLIIEVSLR